MECKYFRVLQLLFDCLQDCADSLWLVFRVDEKCSFVWLMSQRVHLFRIKGVSPLGFAKLMIFASLGLLNSKSKAIAPLAAQADAPYFLGAKSKQKRYPQVRRPAQRAGCPAVLTFAGGQRTRYAQTPLTLLPAKPALLGGYQAHLRQKHKTKVKTKFSDQAQSTIKTIRLDIPTAKDLLLMSH